MAALASNLDLSLDEMMARSASTRKAAPKFQGARKAARPAPYGAKPAGRAVGGAKTVYVGNLSWDVAWQDLKDHFKQAGDVAHADIMMENGTGRSKGCGIVQFSNARDATNAIRMLHDTELNGRLMFVREDREA